MRRGAFTAFVVLLLGTAAVASDAPTFEQLDKELTKYKPRANLVGDTNAQLEFEGMPYYCLFDLFLTVMNDPEHPRHEETRKAWEHNHAKFREQAGLVSTFMGRNLIPLLITSSAKYTRDFQQGAARHAPRFNPQDYVQPGPVTIGEGERAYAVAWFHPAADADGDGVTNRDTLTPLVPNWRPVLNETGRVKKGTGLGVNEEQRDAFVEKALGVASWRTRGR